jgi:putative ATP-dependent endonuclease of the OLD family
MKVARLKIENFKGIKSATVCFSDHTLLVGPNNVGKSTICEALDLVLGPERLNQRPPVNEYDFYNALYLREDGKTPIPITIEAIITDLSEELERLYASNVELWNRKESRLLGEGEHEQVDKDGVETCLRIATVAQYDADDDEFVAKTILCSGHADGEEPQKLSPKAKRLIGFLYLRAVRTGVRAFSLERGSLLDLILQLKEVRIGLWERLRRRLAELDPPIDAQATELAPILREIEGRLAEYVPTPGDRVSRFFVSQLTREHLRKTISFFLTLGNGEVPIPFHEAGTGTANILVLALLTFIAETKADVIFAMEEPEIALPPHTQRRILHYLQTQTTQCFVTSHSPYVIEKFEPSGILRLTRQEGGVVEAKPLSVPGSMKAKTYRSTLRRYLAESILGQGAIVGEGQTEQYMLLACAGKLEETDSNLFPLDLAGVSIINAEGDGNLSALGDFFRSLGIPSFALFDKKPRKKEELDRIRSSFDVAVETDKAGAESLLAHEVPLDRQWQFLTSHQDRSDLGIPATRPSEHELRKLTERTLSGLKGEGGAAELVELCSKDELPPTVVSFLMGVYSRFPRPSRPMQDSAKQRPENEAGNPIAP